MLTTLKIGDMIVSELKVGSGPKRTYVGFFIKVSQNLLEIKWLNDKDYYNRKLVPYDEFNQKIRLNLWKHYPVSRTK